MRVASMISLKIDGTRHPAACGVISMAYALLRATVKRCEHVRAHHVGEGGADTSMDRVNYHGSQEARSCSRWLSEDA